MNTPTKPVNAANGTVNIDPTAVNSRADRLNTHPPVVNTSRPTGGPTDRPSGGDGGKKQSAAVRLVALARERYTFVMSTDGRPYAVAIDGPNLALPLRGRTGLRQRLARLHADTFEGDVASQSALADAMTVLEGIADEGPIRPFRVEGALYPGRGGGKGP